AVMGGRGILSGWRRRKAVDPEPRSARGDPIHRGDVSDVPQNDVGLLDALVGVVYGRSAPGGSRFIASGRAPGSPGLLGLELQSPELGLVAGTGTYLDSPARCLVVQSPFVLRRQGRLVASFVGDICPLSARSLL